MRTVAWVLLISALSIPAAAAPPCSAGPVWNYCMSGDYGENGPANWGRIGTPPVWPACNGTTVNQSPMILTATPRYRAIGPLVLSYQTMPLRIANTGHALKVIATQTQSIKLGTQAPLELQEFHFHIPAEHSLPRVNAVAELHLVHRDPANPAGTPTAIAVLVVNGGNTPNPALDSLVAAASKVTMCADMPITGATVDLHALVPASLADSFLAYDGSLTTPDCSPVHWLILKTPIAMSQQQLKALNLFGSNARPPISGTAPIVCYPQGPNCQQ